MTTVRFGLLLLAMVVSATPPALAQTTGKFAIGAQVSKRGSTGPEAHGNLGLGLLWRIGRSKTGFRWDWG